MQTNHWYLIAAIAFLACCVAYRMWPRRIKGQSLASFAQPLRSLSTREAENPFESAFNAIEEEARKKAAGIVGGRLSDHRAEEIVEKFQAAFAKKEPSVPNSPSPIPPASGSSAGA